MSIPLAKLATLISGHQWSSVVISGHQWQEHTPRPARNAHPTKLGIGAISRAPPRRARPLHGHRAAHLMTRGNSWQLVVISGARPFSGISHIRNGHPWRSSIQWHQPHTCPEASSIATQKQEPGELR